MSSESEYELEEGEYFPNALENNPDKYLKLTKSKSEVQDVLVEKIKSIKTTGLFAVSGTCHEYRSLTNPGLYVDGKLWTFPLVDIPTSSVLEDAPFGKGTETILDHTVRKTLQVNPSKVVFKNPDYAIDILELAKIAARDLGLENFEFVEPHFHKLLIYREGDHFSEHRDAVHREGMFGTLIVQLPSIFTGGKLNVTHAENTVSFLNNDEFQSSWVAFYGDCLHNIEPVVSGIRVALTYDLVRIKPPKNPQSSIPIIAEIPLLHKEVTDWIQDKKADPALYIACEHLYPRAILGDVYKNGMSKHNYQTLINELKGADQARAKALYMKDVIMGLVPVCVSFHYDPDGYYRHTLTALDLVNSRNANIKPSSIFAPNGFTKTPVKHMRSRAFAEHTGNDAQLGELALTYSAIVVIPLSKVKKIKLLEGKDDGKD